MFVSPRSLAALILIGVLYWTGVAIFVGDALSSDLRSLWLAGLFFQSGNPAEVYAMSESYFTMEPPVGWIEYTLSAGTEIPVYPFIYPPLWAWAMSHVTTWISYHEFVLAASFVNRILVPLMFVLAWRILKPRMSIEVYLGFSLILVLYLMGFLLALEENQPQIWVSFLILLAIERQRNGGPLLAGAALALAAALKLYPIVFAILWLAAGDRKAALAFAIFGGALGLLSLAVADWSFHSALLGELRAISSGVLLSLANFSAPTLTAVLTLPESALTNITTEATGGRSEWWVGPKSATWQTLERGLQILTFVALTAMAFKTKMKNAAHWPFAIMLVAWVSPLSWIYHYMTALVFLPAIVGRWGLRGAALIAICLIPASFPLFVFRVPSVVNAVTIITFANIGILVITYAFFRLGQQAKADQTAEKALPSAE